MTTKTARTEIERDEVSTFRTHTGELIDGDRLQSALREVADDWRRLAYAIRSADEYDPDVTEAQKDGVLHDALQRADEIERGVVRSFTIWQRVNTKLTGVCAPLFSLTPRPRKITGRSAIRVDDVSRKD
jgi:hypothetical protein